MNNIHEKDWAEDIWGGYSGMDNRSGWCNLNKAVDDKPVTDKDDNESSTDSVSITERSASNEQNDRHLNFRW